MKRTAAFYSNFPVLNNGHNAGGDGASIIPLPLRSLLFVSMETQFRSGLTFTGIIKTFSVIVVKKRRRGRVLIGRKLIIRQVESGVH